MVERESGAARVSARTVEDLCQLILAYQSNTLTGNWTAVFEKYMQKSINAEAYAHMILEG
jgi:hypothetical protein